MVKPAGTGRPMRHISARLAPLPPSSSFILPLPSAALPPKEYTYLLIEMCSCETAPRFAGGARGRPPGCLRWRVSSAAMGEVYGRGAPPANPAGRGARDAASLLRLLEG